MDAGGIFSQAKLPITNQDDVGTMFEKLSLLGKELLLKTLPKDPIRRTETNASS